MRVLHVLGELKPSGAETMLRSAAAHWAAHDISCEVLATGTAVGEYAGMLRAAGYAIHHLPEQRSLSYFERVRELQQSNGYDIVHQHRESMSFWFCTAALRAGTRVVRTIHNNFKFNGTLRLRRALQRKLLALGGVRFVAVGPGVQATELERFRNKSTLIWNWIDTDQFRPIQQDERARARLLWDFDDRDLVVASVGNCSAIKNHQVIIDAMARIESGSRVRYLHVGLEDAEQSERKFAARHQILGHIRFAGWMSSPRDALAAADLYVMPSTHEGFSIAALEALCVGIPCLFAESDGLVDLRHAFPDLLYARPETDSIAAALRTFLARPFADRNENASSHAAIASEKFSVARGVREYAELYRSLVLS